MSAAAELRAAAREDQFAAELGERLRQIREDDGLRQDDIASRARRMGLAWARSSVAMLERGSRNLSVLEWLALPEIYHRPPRVLIGGVDTRPGPPVTSPDETDQKIARRLGATPEQVRATALTLWGRSIAEERDASAGTVRGRSGQAARGHVTRALAAELAAALTIGSTP